MENKPKSIEAARAEAAFGFADGGMEKHKNYTAAVREIPSLIRMNGLRATLAYCFQKEKGHGEALKNIRDWFSSKDPVGLFKKEEINDVKAFVKKVISLDGDEYRIAQAETLALANWMIRFVKTQEEETKKEVKNDDAP